MITADQIIAHEIGDYLLQSDWMAQTKAKDKFAATIHGLVYAMPFIFLGASPLAWFVIWFTHAIIDHYRLARYLVWLKNFLAPKWLSGVAKDGWSPAWYRNHTWKQCDKTGYHNDSPPWLSVWLMIRADNIIHIVINGLALRYL